MYGALGGSISLWSPWFASSGIKLAPYEQAVVEVIGSSILFLLYSDAPYEWRLSGGREPQISRYSCLE